MLSNLASLRKAPGIDLKPKNPEKAMLQKQPVALLPHIGAVFRHDSPVFYQRTSPGNHSPVVKVIIADDLEFRLMSAAYVAI